MQYNGLFIGLTTIDIQYFVDVYPGSNQKVKTNPPEILVGGPATNAAVAFSKLNSGAHLVSPSGNNSFSEFIKKDIVKTGISHTDPIKSQNKNAVLATVITSENNGDRTVYSHHPEPLNTDFQLNKLFTNVKPQIVLLDGFYPEIAISSARMASEKQIPVVLDCGSWKPQLEQLIPLTDVVICSEDFYPPGCSKTADTINYLEEQNVKYSAVSRGGKDILTCVNGMRGKIAIEQVNVKDTLGAGDFLHGAFCFFYLSEKGDFNSALTKAAAVATQSCKYRGTREWLNFSE